MVRSHQLYRAVLILSISILQFGNTNSQLISTQPSKRTTEIITSQTSDVFVTTENLETIKKTKPTKSSLKSTRPTRKTTTTAKDSFETTTDVLFTTENVETTKKTRPTKSSLRPTRRTSMFFSYCVLPIVDRLLTTCYMIEMISYTIYRKCFNIF